MIALPGGVFVTFETQTYNALRDVIHQSIPDVREHLTGIQRDRLALSPRVLGVTIVPAGAMDAELTKLRTQNQAFEFRADALIDGLRTLAVDLSQMGVIEVRPDVVVPRDDEASQEPPAPTIKTGHNMTRPLGDKASRASAAKPARANVTLMFNDEDLAPLAYIGQRVRGILVEAGFPQEIAEKLARVDADHVALLEFDRTISGGPVPDATRDEIARVVADRCVRRGLTTLRMGGLVLGRNPQTPVIDPRTVRPTAWSILPY